VCFSQLRIEFQRFLKRGDGFLVPIVAVELFSLFE
jgi:hypothetical protein